MKIAGLALGFLGAALVVTRGQRGRGAPGPAPARGDLLILASTVNWAVYTVLGHPVLRRLGPARATTGALLFGWLMLVPFFVYAAGWREYRPAHRRRAGRPCSSWGSRCSGLGYLFWYGALERIEASRVAAFLYLEPLVTLAAAVVMLGESVALTTVAGGLLVLAGVALVQRDVLQRPARGA